MEVPLKRKKARKTKRIYLVREIREIWDRMSSGATLRVNKIRAHCLDSHDADFSFEQVRDSLWAFFSSVNKENGGGNFHSAIPETSGGRFVGLVKIGDDAEGRALLEDYRKRQLTKDGQRLATHKLYLDTDVAKGLLTRRISDRIVLAAGLSPLIKELPQHQER